jgi:hypothetical protein
MTVVTLMTVSLSALSHNRRRGDLTDTVGERYFVREAQVYTLAK